MKSNTSWCSTWASFVLFFLAVLGLSTQAFADLSAVDEVEVAEMAEMITDSEGSDASHVDELHIALVDVEDSVLIYSRDNDAGEWEGMLLSESQYNNYVSQQRRKSKNTVLGAAIGAAAAVALACLVSEKENGDKGCNNQTFLWGLGGGLAGGVIGSHL